MKKGYTTKEKVENYILREIDASFDDQIDEWIEAAESHIDSATGRNFKADDTASVRLYDGDNSSELLIDDCVELTQVQIDTDTPLAINDEVFAYPLNKTPKTKLKQSGGTFRTGTPGMIKVMGKWGYSVEVPADIKFAATVIVAGIVNFANNAEGEVQSMSIGRYSVTYKTKQEVSDFERVKEILSTYKKFTF